MGDPRKTPEDLELEERVRAWLRYEIEERGISQNEMERKLGLGTGTLNKILKGSRGFSPGLILLVIRKVGIRAAQLLQEDPPSHRRAEDPERASPATGHPGKPKTGGRFRRAL